MCEKNSLFQVLFIGNTLSKLYIDDFYYYYCTGLALKEGT